MKAETLIKLRNTKKLNTMKRYFVIIMDNSKANSHNINIDYPEFWTFASSEAEALKNLIASNFEHKTKEIFKISIL